jgi:hypothetical protein
VLAKSKLLRHLTAMPITKNYDQNGNLIFSHRGSRTASYSYSASDDEARRYRFVARVDFAMDISLKNFPITGSECSAVLSAAAQPEEMWALTDIETMGSALQLGNLWRQVRGGPVSISTSDLCAALNLAHQVITLHVRLKKNLSMELYIEDGMVFERHLL